MALWIAIGYLYPVLLCILVAAIPAPLTRRGRTEYRSLAYGNLACFVASFAVSLYFTSHAYVLGLAALVQTQIVPRLVEHIAIWILLVFSIVLLEWKLRRSTLRQSVLVAPAVQTTEQRG